MERGTREYVLDRVVVAGGDERALLLTVRPGWRQDISPSVDFVERHSGGGPGWSGRARRFAVTADLDEVEPVVALLEAQLEAQLESPSASSDVADRLAAALTALARRGELDDTLPPMGARERVAGWFAEAGVPYRRNSWLPIIKLAPGLMLTFELGDSWVVKVLEGSGEHRAFEVTTAYQSIDAVIDYLQQRYGAVRYAGHPDDRINHLVVVFAALVEDGRLAPQLPVGASADQVATWYAEAGVAYQRCGERRHPVLRTYRDNTGCSFMLTLGISSRADRIWFAEDYEYSSRPGDAGREYAYSVKTPYASLDRLVAFFTGRLDLAVDGDLEDRLLACFTELVRRGDLSDDLGIEQNRDRVADWFSDAGVPAEPDFWTWINSD